jgi:hypothetical protein
MQVVVVAVRSQEPAEQVAQAVVVMEVQQHPGLMPLLILAAGVAVVEMVGRLAGMVDRVL